MGLDELTAGLQVRRGSLVTRPAGASVSREGGLSPQGLENAPIEAWGAHHLGGRHGWGGTPLGLEELEEVLDLAFGHGGQG